MQRFARALAGVVAFGACHAAPAPAAPNTPHGDDDAAAEDRADDPEDPNDQLPAVAPPATSAAGVATGAALLAEAQRELAAVRASHYVHRTSVDEARGVFDFDCSGFVGYALSRVAPVALRAIQAQTRPRPLAKHFEAVLAAPPPDAPWSRVERASELAPGDVIAWLEPAAKHSRNTGHVMIVAGPVSPGRDASELVVPVIDSSHSGHGKADARIREHRNGLGVGNIVLRVDADGRPIGYRWSTWRKSVPYTTTISLGRLK